MSCIYLVTNTINGKHYVGQTQDMDRRKKGHKRDAEKGSSLIFHRAIRKYGWDAFEWKALFVVEGRALNRWERYYIKRLNTRSPNGYNLTDGGDGVVNPSVETRVKIARSHLGLRPTLESKAKNREAHLGRVPWNKGKPFSEECCAKMSRAHKGKSISLEQRKKIGLSLKGIRRTPETIARMRKAQKGNKSRLGQHNSEEHKAHQREGWARRKLALMMLGA